MSENKDLGLSNGEKLLIKTKTIENKKNFLSNLLLFSIFGIAGIILLIIRFFI